MIPTKEMVDDAKREFRGPPVAYVDRMTYIGRTRKVSQEANIADILFRMPKKASTIASDDGWGGIWKELGRNPLLAFSALVHAAGGLSQDALVSAATYVGFRRPNAPIRGRISSVQEIDGVVEANILVPVNGGGAKNVLVGCKGDILRDNKIGGPVDLYQRKGKHPYWRVRCPYVTSLYKDKSPSDEYLDAKEISDVVSAQYNDHDFCGQWTQDREANASIRRRLGHSPSKQLFSLFKNENNDAILVFRGTDPTSIKDWAVNIMTTQGKITDQYAAAVAATIQAKKHCNRLIVSGHSKGGGLAQYAALSLGFRGVCFNSVGLPPDLIHKKNDSPGVDHFAVKYDWVSNVGGVYREAGMGISIPVFNILSWGKSGIAKEQRLLARKDDVHLLSSQYNRWRIGSLHSIESVSMCLGDDPHLIKQPFNEKHSELPTRTVRVKSLLEETELAGRSESSPKKPTKSRSLVEQSTTLVSR